MITIPFVEDWIKNFRTGLFEDKIDRLHYFFTTRVLLLLALMAGVKNYFGSPLSCWIPKEFHGSWEQYVKDLCFVESTYYVPIQTQIPQNITLRESRMKFTAYYQWVPIILAIQALLFYTPNFVWTYFNFKQGRQAKKILAVGSKAASVATKEEERPKHLEKVAECFVRAFRIGKARKPALKFPSCLGYLGVKLMYLGNVLFQLFTLNSVVGSDYSFWGIQTLLDIAAGRLWQVSGQFPRTGLCDVEIRAEISNIQRYTIQCVLNINVLNEKIFILVWLWLALLAVVTLFNIVYWIAVICVGKIKAGFVRGYVNQMEKANFEAVGVDKVTAACQIYGRLELDALLLLRFLESRADDEVCKTIIAAVWKAICGKKGKEKALEFSSKSDSSSGLPASSSSGGPSSSSTVSSNISTATAK